MLMVIDATGRPAANGDFARTALARKDVIGTPLAAQVFSITDAIYEHDARLFQTASPARRVESRSTGPNGP